MGRGAVDVDQSIRRRWAARFASTRRLSPSPSRSSWSARSPILDKKKDIQGVLEYLAATCATPRSTATACAGASSVCSTNVDKDASDAVEDVFKAWVIGAVLYEEDQRQLQARDYRRSAFARAVQPDSISPHEGYTAWNARRARADGARGGREDPGHAARGSRRVRQPARRVASKKPGADRAPAAKARGARSRAAAARRGWSSRRPCRVGSRRGVAVVDPRAPAGTRRTAAGRSRRRRLATALSLRAPAATAAATALRSAQIEAAAFDVAAETWTRPPRSSMTWPRRPQSA